MKDLDLSKLRPFAPIAAAVVILTLGWIFVIGPSAARNARTARELDAVRQRLMLARRAASGPAPAASTGDPAAVFERTLAARDATPLLLEQLARRAADDAHAAGLSIETGEPATVNAASGPQVANQPQPDPRLALFDASLTYSPLTMSFDAEYPAVGTFLWNLRELATVIEIRSIELQPVPQRTPPIEHVTMTLFAFARQAPAAAVLRASGPGGRR